MSKPASRRTLGSDLARVDLHAIKPSEYKELFELTDEVLARAVVKKGAPAFAESKTIHLAALAAGGGCAMARHWARLANPYGRPFCQGAAGRQRATP